MAQTKFWDFTSKRLPYKLTLLTMINALSRFGNTSTYTRTTSKISIAQDLSKKERRVFRDSSRLKRSCKTKATARVVSYGIKTLVSQARILINNTEEGLVATFPREPKKSGKD